MTPRSKLRKLGAFALTAGVVLWFGVLASNSFAGDAMAPLVAANDFMPGSDTVASRPPATFFSINAVLAKLDRQRGRGPEAIRFAALTPSHVATDAQAPEKELPELGKEPFGLFTFRAPEGMLWRKWRGLEADVAKEQTLLERCRATPETCPAHAVKFLRLIEAVKSRSGRAQLDKANRAVNAAIRYVSDFAQHGEADRWSAPLATFATAKGDCEDYAIAKYVALTEAGFSRDDLQLVLVRDRAVRQDHAVLAARLEGRWQILDNRHSELIEDSDAASFTPLFAIDHRGVQLFAAPYAKRGLLGGEVEAAPAAAGETDSGWTN